MKQRRLRRNIRAAAKRQDPVAIMPDLPDDETFPRLPLLVEGDRPQTPHVKHKAERGDQHGSVRHGKLQSTAGRAARRMGFNFWLAMGPHDCTGKAGPRGRLSAQTSIKIFFPPARSDCSPASSTARTLSENSPSDTGDRRSRMLPRKSATADASGSSVVMPSRLRSERNFEAIVLASTPPPAAAPVAYS